MATPTTGTQRERGPALDAGPHDPPPIAAPPDVNVDAIRAAKAAWCSTDFRTRTHLLRRFRHNLVNRQSEWVAAVEETQPRRPAATTLAAELLPLAEACRFLERNLAQVLKPRRLGRNGRPFWLSGLAGRVERVPHGIVLVVGPSNYPLQLPGIQLLQALAAGNAALLKPAPGCAPVADRLATALVEAGLPTNLLTVLPESPSSVSHALAAGVDKVVLTGSAETGRAVLASSVPVLVPCTMELSGCDAAFVLSSGDLELAADAIAYGATLNEGRTCIAPRRVFVARARVPKFEQRLAQRLVARGVATTLPDPVADRVRAAIAHSGDIACGGIDDRGRMTPTLLTGVDADNPLLRQDTFAPIVALIPVDDWDEARRIDATCPFGLGASIFGDRDEAQRLARTLRVGCVTVNDVIVPTADPRVPFGGRRESGFGVTRGPEGLLAMTVPKVVQVRMGRSRPHLDADGDDPAVMSALLRALHGGSLGQRLAGWCGLIRGRRPRADDTRTEGAGE